MDGKVFLSRQSRLFSFIVNIIEVLLSICTLTWPANSYVSSQGKGINRRTEGNVIFTNFLVLTFCNSVDCF